MKIYFSSFIHEQTGSKDIDQSLQWRKSVGGGGEGGGGGYWKLVSIMYEVLQRTTNQNPRL